MNWIPSLPEKLRNEPVKQILTSLVSVLLVVLAPAFLFTGLNNFFAEENIKRQKADQIAEMSALLGDIAGLSEPLQRFNVVFKQLSQIAFPSKVFDKRLKQILRRNPGSFDIYFFRKNHKCFDLDYLPRAPKFVAQKFFSAMLNPEDSKKDEKWLVKFSGYRLAHKFLAKSFGSVCKLGKSDDRQWGGWFPLQDTSGNCVGYFLAFIRKSALDEESLLDQSVSLANQNHKKEYSFAWQDPCNPEVLRSSSEGFSSETVTILNKLPYGETEFVEKGRNGIKYYIDSGLAIVSLSQRVLIHGPIFYYISFSIKIAAVLAIIFLLPVFLGITSFKPGLKAKLVALLLVGAGSCMLSLIFTGVIDRSDREKVLNNHYQQRNLEELNRIDEGVSFEFKRLEKVLKSSINKLSGLNDEQFHAQLPKLWGSLSAFAGRFKELLLIEPSGTLLYMPGSREPVSWANESTAAMYGEMILQTYQGKYLAPSHDTQSTSVKDVVKNSSSTFSRNLILKGDGFESLTLAESSVPTYLEFFLGSDNQARGLLLALLSNPGIQRNYLHSISKLFDSKKEKHHPRFVALPILASLHWPAFPKRRSAENDILKKISVMVISQDLAVHSIERINGKTFLLSAVKGKLLDGYVLILARPYEVVMEKIKILNKKISLLAIFILLLAGLSAWITSRLVLKPIIGIREILNSISNGNFRAKAKPEVVKEFAAVANSLNRTLEGFQELKVARSIQENLWPEKSLKGLNWELEGRCKAASELGGDHIEWLELNDGRVLFVIGDVAGHGIGAAMIQASIKVWMALKASEAKSASELLKEVNRLHCKYGTKKLPMCCWAGYFYPETGKINFTSAGGCYPIVLSADGSKQILKTPDIPLGIRLRASYAENEILLLPGQSLILYTDGIIETLDEAEKMIGFTAFEDKCSDLNELSTSEFIEEIFAFADRWGKQNDDQTLIVLRRTGDTHV